LPSFESLDLIAEELAVDFFLSFVLSSASSVLSAKRSSTSRGLWAIGCRARARARSGVEEKKLDSSEFISEGGEGERGVDESDDGVGSGRGSRKRGGLCCRAAHWRKQCWSAAGNHGSRAQVRHLVKLLIIIVFLIFFFFFIFVLTVVLFLRAFGIGVFSYSSPSSSSSSSSSPSPNFSFGIRVFSSSSSSSSSSFSYSSSPSSSSSQFCFR
jgi:hypothetical protein